MGVRIELEGLGETPAPAIGLSGYSYQVGAGDLGLTYITWRFGRRPGEWYDLLRANPQVLPPYYTVRIGDTLALPAGWPDAPVQLYPVDKAWALELKNNYPPPGQSTWDEWWKKPPPAPEPDPVPLVDDESQPPPGLSRRAKQVVGVSVAAVVLGGALWLAKKFW